MKKRWLGAFEILMMVLTVVWGNLVIRAARDTVDTSLGVKAGDVR
jgi:hypothetical protein